MTRDAPTPIARMLAACALLVAVSASSAQAPAAPARLPSTVPDSLTGGTTVSYVVGESVYLNAGSRDGLYAGSRVLVVRDTLVLAELKVTVLSSHHTACAILSASDSIRVDDSVRFSVAPPEIDVPTIAVEPFAAPRSALHEFGVRGAVGVSYQMLAPLSSSTGSLSQPALQLRMEGAGIGGTAISFNVDARARRTFTPDTGARGSSYDGTRVYQSWVNWRDTVSGVRVTLGRQFSSALAPLSLYDGATVELDKARWAVGAFAGSQPAPATMAFSSQIREYGGYVQLHRTAPSFVTPTDREARWTLTLGGIGTYDGGQINREFTFAQAYYADRRWQLWATQEVDLNRGWKADSLHEPTLQPTNTFATAQWTVSDALYVHGGLDNRRNVILYRDYVSPVTQFDDSFRQGVWGGLSWLPAPAWRVGFDARLSDGGPTGEAVSYTASAVTDRGLPLQGTARLRATSYTSSATVCGDAIITPGVACSTPSRRTASGWLVAAAYGISPLLPLHLELNGGFRADNSTAGAAALLVPQTNVHWIGLDLDYLLGSAWYVLLSVTHTDGGAEGSNVAYTSLSYRY